MGLQSVDTIIDTPPPSRAITPRTSPLSRIFEKLTAGKAIKKEIPPSETEVLRSQLTTLIDNFRTENALDDSQPIEWEAFNAFIQAYPERQLAFDSAVEGLWPLYMTPEYADQVFVATALELRQSTVTLLEQTIDDIVSEQRLDTYTLGLLSSNITEIRGNQEVGLRGIMEVLVEATKRHNIHFKVIATCYTEDEREALKELSKKIPEGITFEVLDRTFDIRDRLPEELQSSNILMATLVLSYLPRNEQLRIIQSWQEDLIQGTNIILGVPVSVGTVMNLQKVLGDVLQVRPQGPLERTVERVVAQPLRGDGEKPLSIEKARTGFKGVIAKIFMVAKLLQITQGDVIRLPRNIKKLLAYVEKAADPLARISEPLLDVGAHYNWTSTLVTELQQMGVGFEKVIGSIPAYDATYPWIAGRIKFS